MTVDIEPNLNATAHAYFGGDVQRYWIERDAGEGYQCYRLYQQPHWLPMREAASVIAKTAAEARHLFNRMAEAETWAPDEEEAA